MLPSRSGQCASAWLSHLGKCVADRFQVECIGRSRIASMRQSRVHVFRRSAMADRPGCRQGQSDVSMQITIRGREPKTTAGCGTVDADAMPCPVCLPCPACLAGFGYGVEAQSCLCAALTPRSRQPASAVPGDEKPEVGRSARRTLQDWCKNLDKRAPTLKFVTPGTYDATT